MREPKTGGASRIRHYDARIGPSGGVMVALDVAIVEVQAHSFARIGFPWGMTEHHDFGVEPIGRQLE